MPPMKSSSVSPLRSAVLVLALVAAVVAALAAGWAARGDGSARHPATAAVRTDRGVKADLLAKLARPPQVLIFGGSRAVRFEPAYLQRLTGLPGFNLALQNGRPEDAWAFIAYARRIFPGLRPRVLWFVHVEAFRKQRLSPGVTDDPRLARAFPPSLIAAERAKPDPTNPVARAKELAQTTYGPDGVVLRNRYNIRAARGYTLERGLAWSIAKAEERYRHPQPALDPRAQRYFEKTLALENELGRTPVIVFMPTQPELMAAIRASWQQRHDRVMTYLDSLKERYRFTVIDLSDLSSVPEADPNAFYDGIHVRLSNARRILQEVVRRAGDALK
jgi:hypothetical protein